ncbi:MAG: SCP2 sterol-binding domain-containing protein, partial [Kineosporiaceae bacterium]
NGSVGRYVAIGFDLGDDGSYRLVADDGRLSLDRHASDAATVLYTDAETLLALLHGERNPGTTLFSGQARLEGDPELGGRLLTYLVSRASSPG